MKWPFFSKSNPDNAPLLALDIGTEYVKAVIFDVDKHEGKVIIKGYGRAKQHSNAMRSAMVINIENVVKSCDLAIGEALGHADELLQKKVGDENVETPLPQKVILGIAGELVNGIAIMAEYSREDIDHPITKEEIEEVVASIKARAFEDALDDVAEEIGVKPERLQEINSQINASYIDGLRVDSPLGMTGEHISHKIYATFAPALHVNALREVVAQLKLETRGIVVEPYALTRSLKGALVNNFSGIFIDIGGGTTDVAVAQQGSIVGTKMFAYGGRVFTQRIAKDLDKDLHEAEQLKLQYSAGELDKVTEATVRQSIQKDMSVWLQGVYLALDEMEDIDTYSGDIYLCGGGSLLPDIKQALIEYPWSAKLPFLKHPKVVFVYPEDLDSIVDETGELEKVDEIAVLSLARMALEIDN